MCFCYRFAPPIVGADAATVVAAFAVGMVANVCATEYLYSSLLVPYRHHMGTTALDRVVSRVNYQMISSGLVTFCRDFHTW